MGLGVQGKLWRWVVLLAMGVAVWRVTRYWHVYNDTWDEAANIGAASALYTRGRPLLDVQHPPLSRWVIGLPMALGGVHWIAPPGGLRTDTAAVAWDVGFDLLFNDPQGYWKVLTLARLGALLWLPVAIGCAYGIGRRLAGRRAGAVGAVLLSTEPTFLAHIGLATNDGASVAGTLLILYFAVRWWQRPRLGRGAAFGVVAAIGVCTKFSVGAVLVGVLTLMAYRVIAHRLRRRGRRTVPRQHLRPVVQGVTFLLLASLTTWAIYGFSLGRMDQTTLTTRLAGWDHVPAVIKRAPVPMHALPVGLLQLIAHTRGGHPTFFDGQLLPLGHPLYLPTAFVLKLPLGVLAAMAAGLVGLLLWRRRFPALLLLVPIALFALGCLNSKTTIGVRYLLPLIGLLCVAGAVGAFQCRVRWARLAVVLRAVVVAGLLAAFVETGPQQPDYLAFFNRLTTRDRAARVLVDSNLDWGQDIYRFSQWARHDARDLPLSMDLAHPEITRLARFLKIPSVNDYYIAAGRPGTFFAVSVNCKVGLMGVHETADGTLAPGCDYAFLRHYPRVALIGRSIEVYDLRTMPADEWRKFKRRPANTPSVARPSPLEKKNSRPTAPGA